MTALLIAASAAFAAGGVCMKWSEGLTRLWPSFAFFALFIAGAAIQALAMRQAQMGTVYLSVLGLEAVLAFSLGVFLFGEPYGASRVAAVGLIAAGLILLHR